MGTEGLGQLLILLAAVMAVVMAVRRLQLPPILGYLAAGMALGPYALGLVDDTPGTRWLAELGVVFLLFTLGLEFSLPRMLAMRRPAGTIFDLGSLKSPLRGGRMALKSHGCRVTSVHPMFGPDTELLSGRHVIFVDLGVPEALAAARELFAPTMVEQVVMTLDEHDRLIAYVLGLSHALNIAFFTALAESGEAAPRLNDVVFSAEEARAHHATLLQEVVRMLCAGVVHGDLSEFNILLSADGPVIIDLPQAVDAAGNNHAKRMLLRDVENLRHFFGRFAPDLLATDFGHEIWGLYERGLLQPDSALTGHFEKPKGPADVGSVLREIDDAKAEEAARRLRMSTG